MSYDVLLRCGTAVLAQGNIVAAGTADLERFDTIVFCAKEVQPPREEIHDPRFRIAYAPLDDGELDPAETWIAENASAFVARELRGGRRVLVTCFMGLNRSGLVSALAIVRFTEKSGAEAIRVVQRYRSGALVNRAFVRYLERIPAKTGRYA